MAVRQVLAGLHEKGFAARVERLVAVPSTLMDGSDILWTCYCAIKVRPIGQDASAVIAVVAEVMGGSPTQPWMRVLVQSEDVNPEACQCPPYVLEALTPTACPMSKEWRGRASRHGRDHFTYRMLVETMPSGRRCISVVLSTKSHACEVARSSELDDHSFQRMWDEFALRYGMSDIEALRCL